MKRDRRRYPRVGVALRVQVQAGDHRWTGTTVDVGPYGIKLTGPASDIALPPGSRAQVQVVLPDGQPPISLTASIVRSDAGGIALNVVNIEAVEFARLRQFVDRTLQQLSSGTEVPGSPATAVKDRRRSRRVNAALDIRLRDPEQPHGWRGKTIDLSESGVKVAFPDMPIRPSWGSGIQVQLSGPDGHPPLSVKGIVWRREPESMSVLFVELGRQELERLKTLVNSLARGTPG